MCSEGLDIPTLNAEFLISPKTDIVQSVGRILRAKHVSSNPIIYDFVDSHDVFQRQWLKRKSYFKKQNYKIIGTNSFDYTKDTSNWKLIFQPGKCIKNDDLHNTDDEDDGDDENKKSKGVCLIKIKKCVL
jgi:superfamily II DNA or RNA helicase